MSDDRADDTKRVEVLRGQLNQWRAWSQDWMAKLGGDRSRLDGPITGQAAREKLDVLLTLAKRVADGLKRAADDCGNPKCPIHGVRPHFTGPQWGAWARLVAVVGLLLAFSVVMTARRWSPMFYLNIGTGSVSACVLIFFPSLTVFRPSAWIVNRLIMHERRLREWRERNTN